MDGKPKKIRRESAAGGRRRSAQMLLRLTPEEREEIASKAREAGMTQADFVLESVRGTRVFVQRDVEKTTLLFGIRYQVSRVGNNLNQIARVLNSAAKVNRSMAVEAELANIDDAVGVVLKTLSELHEAICREGSR